MDWIAPYSLGNSAKLIRKFLIEVASMEEVIAYEGLYVTRAIDGFDSAVVAMDEFPELFYSMKRNIANIDGEIYLQLDHLERESSLVEQVSLINLKLQMSRGPKYRGFLRALAGMGFFSSSETKRVFGEESISLERIIINCDKLISSLKLAEEVLRYREESDDGIFKPSKIQGQVVVDLIDKALDELSGSECLTEETKLLAIAYLREIKAQALSKFPKWQSIIGSLVVVAALTSGLADAPAASKTLQSLVEYLVGASVPMPEQPHLPALPWQKPIDEALFGGTKI